MAHRLAPSSVLASFISTQMIGAALLGLMLFDEWPEHWTLVGGAVSISSGFYLLWHATPDGR